MIALHLPPQRPPLPLVSKGFKGSLPTASNAAASTTSSQWQRFLAQVAPPEPDPQFKAPLSLCVTVTNPLSPDATQLPFNAVFGLSQTDCFKRGLLTWSNLQREDQEAGQRVQTLFNGNLGEASTPFTHTTFSQEGTFGNEQEPKKLEGFVPEVLSKLLDAFPGAKPLVHPDYLHWPWRQPPQTAHQGPRVQ
jgi:hypothetical protein